MSGKLIDRLVAAVVFVYSLVLYWMTIAETTSFWDSGEFIAISHGLQVSHPPGAPFYMLVGRFFSMVFAPLFGALTPEPVAYAVAFLSVVSSALTVLLTHLVIVRLARIWAGHPATWTAAQRVAINAGGLVGALTLAATDAFWFNAVEAEVYAMSMLFTVLVVWLALVWRDATRAEEAAIAARGEHPFGLHADRYLLAIAYLFGLAIGVHLLNVLTLFFIALIVFFQKVDRPEWTLAQRVRGVLVTGVVSAALFFVIYPGVVQILPTLAGASGAPSLFVVAVLATCAALVWWTQKHRRPVANLLALTFTLVLVGYSSYALIFIRSAANPPIDENSPDNAEAIVSYLKREQYGSTPLLSGPTYDNAIGTIDSRRDVLFPRRHSPAPHHTRVYQQYRSDLHYFFSHQLGHMYWRYFLWQFVGRASDIQDASWTAGFSAANTGPTPSERAGRTVYWGLPLLLGLIGLAYHVQRDPRRALAVGVLFLVSGVGIILYLNQTPLQPRERDYSYVASFFAFALWIGLGTTGLVELAQDAIKRASAGAARVGVGLAVAAVLFLAVPGWMAVENYDSHDRTGNRLATDFAVNLLESTAPNAVLFTNGDNDTFPLWYAQETMGIRRDVRVVNLSLLNTPWYIHQLRNQWNRESAPVPMTITDQDIADLEQARGPLMPTLFNPTEVALPVSPALFADTAVAGRVDAAALPDQMRWLLAGNPVGQGQAALYTSDLAVLAILRAVAAEGWQRPVYFAGTVAESSELGLQPYFQSEGLARRVLPIARGDADGYVEPGVAEARLARFQFRGLDDPRVYYDENGRAMADGYRSRLATVAAGMARAGRPDLGRALVARLEREVPVETIAPSFGSLYLMAEAARASGDPAASTRLLGHAERIALDALVRATTSSPEMAESAYRNVQFIQATYLLAGAYDEASAFSARLADIIRDPRLRRSPDEMRRDAAELRAARDSIERARFAPVAPPDTLADRVPADAAVPGGTSRAAP